MPAELAVLVYDERQRQRFRDGDLIRDWHARYPILFDERDFSIAVNQAHLGYHFFEWLAAVTLYECMGLLSLVEHYEYDKHKRKQSILTEIVPKETLALIREHKAEFGNRQCPDLLVYSRDYSDWLFCEVKGPADRVCKNQLEFFDELERVSSRPVHIVRFRRFTKASP